MSTDSQVNLSALRFSISLVALGYLRSMGFLSLFLSVILLPLISFGTCTNESQNFTSNPNDLKALTGFSNCLETAILDWNSSTSPNYCTWSGVTCDGLPGIGTRVVGLELGSRRLTGKICESLAGLDQLRVLNLSQNFLTGFLPDKLFHLQNLEVIDLSNNILSGPLNKGAGNLLNLVELDISYNGFSGSLPDIFGSLTRLKVFSAGSNEFTGQLPATLMNSPSLRMLDLMSNSLSGSINLNCSAMKNLVSLNIGYNQFHGPIPDSLSICKKLETIDLAHNNLNYGIPVNFKNLQSLTQLSLSNTSLHNLSTTLEVLSHCKNLSILVLTMNFYNEEMPQGQNLQFTNLKVFVLANSQIKGSIPKWISGCKMLQMLDLSWNHLSGSIPSWFGKFDHLYYLDLSNNSLAGEIPESMTMLLSLQYRNFSLDGTISGFRFYTYGNIEVVMYKRLSGFRSSLVLSHNKLEGTIWPGFGNLKGLHVMDLKENSISGPVPPQLSGMTMLEILDLSHNKLSGEIPQSLVELSFLSNFNVSYNQLHGEIPTGGQFDTFPSTSFEGNWGLKINRYGTSGFVPSHPDEIPAQPDHEKLEIIGFPFGFGAVAGFVITIALCFASGWLLP